MIFLKWFFAWRRGWEVERILPYFTLIIQLDLFTKLQLFNTLLYIYWQLHCHFSLKQVPIPFHLPIPIPSSHTNMNTINQFKTGVQIEHSNMQSSSISLFSCFLDTLSLFFTSLCGDDHHHFIVSEDACIGEKNIASSNIAAQKQFQQLHQIKGPWSINFTSCSCCVRSCFLALKVCVSSDVESNLLL